MFSKFFKKKSESDLKIIFVINSSGDRVCFMPKKGDAYLPFESEYFFDGIYGNFTIPEEYSDFIEDGDSSIIDFYEEGVFSHNFISVESLREFLVKKGIIEEELNINEDF